MNATTQDREIIDVDPETALATIAEDHPELMVHDDWNAIQETVRKFYAPKATDPEWEVFLLEANAHGLDPRKREIMCVSFGRVKSDQKTRDGKDIWVDQHQPYIGVAGLRKLAQLTGRVVSTQGPFWCGMDGEWVDVWLDDRQNPKAAKFTVAAANPVTGQAGDYTGVVTMKRARKTKEGSLAGPWALDAPAMLAKCAEMEAYRRAGLMADVQLDRLMGEVVDTTGELVAENPMRKLHAVGKTRGLGHGDVRRVVQHIDPSVQSLRDADAATMHGAADIIEVLDGDALAAMAAVPPDQVIGAPVDHSAGGANSTGPADLLQPITAKTLEWIGEHGPAVVDRLPEGMQFAYVDRETLNEGQGRDLVRAIDQLRKRSATA